MTRVERVLARLGASGDLYTEMQKSFAAEKEGILRAFEKGGELTSILDSVQDHLRSFLEGSTRNDCPDLESFLSLHTAVSRWASDHGFEKDWLLRYAYFYISRFSQESKLRITEIDIPKLSVRDLKSGPFRFEFEPWLPGTERLEDYERRLRSQLDIELASFFQIYARRANLVNIRRKTNSYSLDSARWAAFAVVRNSDVERIVEKFFSDVSANRTKNAASALAFEHKLKHVRSKFRMLRTFDIPLPN